MDKAKKRRIQQILVCVCIAAVVAFLAVMPMVAKTKPADSGPKASILTETVRCGQLNRELISGGALAEEEAVAVEVPAAVKLTDYLVRDGDVVTAGTPIASVDRVTVMAAISQVQKTLDHLATEIEKAGKTGGEETVTALAGGTVKILYAKKGDSVRNVMLEHGALAVLSLDNLLAVDIRTDSDLRVGKPMTVSFSDGKTVPGRVAKNLGGVMTVTIEDKSYTLGDTVGVTTSNDVYLGSGELYIHSPWNATAYTGNVDSVKVGVGDQLRAGQTLMVLGDVGDTPAYRQLVSQRQEYEALMLKLFKMYQTQVAEAPCDGIVSGISQGMLQFLSDSGEGYTLRLLANAPNGNDEILYTNYVGKVTAVGSNGWSLLVDPQPVTVADYTDLSGVPVDGTGMTQVCTYPIQAPEKEPEGEIPPETGEGASPQTVPVYALVDGAWQQIPTSSVAAGDILLFAADENGEFVWVVRIKETEKTPDAPARPGGSGGFPSGGMGSQSGRPQQTPSFELYGMDMTQIAAVTPQDTMTLSFAVDELDISALEVGMPAQVKINAMGGEKYTATIKEIGNIGTNNGGNSKYTVVLTMDRAKNMLSGMNATVTIVLSTAENVLTVPAAALVERGNQTLVYTGYDAENEILLDPVTVKVGVSDGETVEILEGLTEGQTCYYPYYDKLDISFVPDFGDSGFMFG